MLSGAAGWGSGSAARLAHTRRPVHRVRAARLPRQACARPWHARSSGAAAAAAAAGAPEEPRAPGARHPSPGHAHGTPALTAVAAAAPPPWLRPTSAVALPSRSRALTCPGDRRPCAQPFYGVGSASWAFTHWTHPSARWRSHLRPFGLGEHFGVLRWAEQRLPASANPHLKCGDCCRGSKVRRPAPPAPPQLTLPVLAPAPAEGAPHGPHTELDAFVAVLKVLHCSSCCRQRPNEPPFLPQRGVGDCGEAHGRYLHLKTKPAAA